MPGEQSFKVNKSFLAIPSFIMQLVFWLLDRIPELMKKKAGAT